MYPGWLPTNARVWTERRPAANDVARQKPTIQAAMRNVLNHYTTNARLEPSAEWEYSKAAREDKSFVDFETSGS